jgi:hypothetical protein
MGVTSLSATDALGKSKKKRRSSEQTAQLIRLKRDSVKRDRSDAEIWNDTVRLKSQISQLPRERKVDLWQLQADLLLQAGYPILAAKYATEALRITESPMSTSSSRAWEILAKVSKGKPIQDMVERLAADIRMKGSRPPAFGNDWNYFTGNAQFRRGNIKQAIDHLSDVKMGERYFLPAKYQLAMIHLQNDRFERAETELKILLGEETLDSSPLREAIKRDIVSLARLALARLYYGQQQFGPSIVQFRKVDRDGPWFYDALSEQAWALFMAGYPNHALGALYGAESPFFAEVYNPEIPMLRSIIFYWMCRYDDSRNALADFSERYGKTVEGLASFLDRQRLTPESAYELFENLITGVSSESLRIPRETLMAAAERDSMLLARDQYASLVAEINRMEKRGVFGKQTNSKEPEDTLRAMQSEMRNNLGQAFIAELRDMKSHYEQLYDQAQFLYVELLMSEKEQLLGRTLHASNKISETTNRKIRGWAGQSMSWAGDTKTEYWWDEIGFHIYHSKPECR